MVTARTALVLVGAAGLVAAGATGYLVSEIRHAGGPAASVAIAPVTPEPATGQPVGSTPARELERPAPVVTRPAAPIAVTEPAPRRVAARTEPAGTPRPGVSRAETASTGTNSDGSDLPSIAPTLSVVAPLVVAAAAPVALEPPAPAIQRVELVIEEDSVIGIRLDAAISSATARVEDRITAVVSRDVVVNGRTAAPSGSRVEGHVAFVEEGGKFRGKARIGLRFTTLVLPSSERVPIVTETVFRDGESPTAEATSKIGASAVVGTVLGAIIGGKKGAAIGGAAGAAGGTAVVAKGRQNEAALAAGSLLTLRLIEPAVVIVERE